MVIVYFLVYSKTKVLTFLSTTIKQHTFYTSVQHTKIVHYLQCEVPASFTLVFCFLNYAVETKRARFFLESTNKGHNIYFSTLFWYMLKKVCWNRWWWCQLASRCQGAVVVRWLKARRRNFSGRLQFSQTMLQWSSQGSIGPYAGALCYGYLKFSLIRPSFPISVPFSNGRYVLYVCI